MKSFFWSALLSGLRSHSFRILFVLSLLVIALASVAANFSPRHPATLALDIGISGARAMLTLMVVFWVQELVAKDIERKTVTLVLSYPQGRGTYLLGRYLGIVALTMPAVLMMAGLLYCAVLYNPVLYSQVTPVDLGPAYWLTFFYMAVDLWVVAAFTLLIATLSTTPLLPLLLGLAFAVAAHAIGPTADFLRYSPNAEASHQQALGPLLESSLLLLPDLERLDIRNWPLYGVVPDQRELLWPLLMALCYVGAMLSLASLRFGRRDFV